MTMTSSKFQVRTEAFDTATRPNGVAARQQLRAALGAADEVVVDMAGIVLTPSFADEFLGVLLVELGEERFRRSVKIVNVPDSARPLLRTVLHRRSGNPSPPSKHAAHA